MKQSRWKQGWAWGGCIALVLGGCGGGGGGGEDAGGGADPGGSPQSSVTGLVPAAPARGAQLAADASSLRPLREAATWTYRGEFVAYTGGEASRYDTVTTQTGASTSRVTEAGTNIDNTGPATAEIDIQGGTVSTPTSVDFTGSGKPEKFDLIELRSPVRQGDQYTSIDRRFNVADLDGDGVADQLEVAVYTRVIGEETLTLPGLPTMVAVRVDTTVAGRSRSGADGKPSETVKSTQSVWYVAGVGIVRRHTSLPSESEGTATSDETLSAWDGGNEGIGFMAPVQATAAADIPEFGGATLPGGNSFRAAFGLTDHALVVTSPPDGSTDMAISRLDLRGRVTAVHRHAGISTYEGELASHGQGLMLFRLDSSQDAGFAITRFDADGARVGAIDAVKVDAGGGRLIPTIERFAAAGDGGVVWLLWGCRYVEVGVSTPIDLVLRAFDTAGRPLTPEILVESAALVDGFAFSLTARGDRVLITWSNDVVRYGAEVAVKYGSASVGKPVLAAHTLVSQQASFAQPISPALFDSGGALTWSAALVGNGRLPSTAGLFLDAEGEPVRTGNGPLDGELLTGFAAPADVGNAIVGPVGGPGGRLLQTSTGLDSGIGGPGLTVSWLTVSDKPLTELQTSQIQLDGSEGAQTPLAPVLFADRVLLFGGDGFLSTRVVWLRDAAGR